MSGETVAGSQRLRDMAVVRRIQQNLTPNDGDILLAVENLAHLIRTYSVLHDTITDLLTPYELSFAQYNLLMILYNAPEHHLQMSEIGERMSVTRTNITKLVDCLERAGLVRRANRPGDRRVVLAELTESGLALMREVVPRHFENMRELWTGMEPDDCLQLTHLLLKLRSSLNANHENHGAHTEADSPAQALLR